jgi:uncharacterized protein YbbK (DUF523 family)
MNILVSACLLGVNCRYDGTGVVYEKLSKLKKQHNLIPVCPELFGGLATPRDPAEIVGKHVITCKGEDVTEQYERGAHELLKLARYYEAELAILKERSPSCGHGMIYDGSFTGITVPGEGITAKLLLENRIRVIGETQIEETQIEEIQI